MRAGNRSSWETQIPGVPCCGLLEHTAQAGSVTLILDTGETPAPTTRPAPVAPGPDTPGSAHDRPAWKAAGPAPHRCGRGSCVQFKPCTASCSAFYEKPC